MDRLAALSTELSAILDELHREAARRKLAPLEAPLAWLDEANGWLCYELAQTTHSVPREAVPFTYISVRR